MKKTIYNVIALITMLMFAGCKDESLDPFRFKVLKKGSLLALRGDDGSAGNLDPDQNFFFKDFLQTSDEFSYVADFISEDQSLLQSIDIYAALGTADRVKVTNVDASSWSIPDGGNSRRGKVTVSRAAILSALGISDAAALDLKRTDIVVTSDIILTDGTIVLAESIINSGLYSAAAFFPAHTLNYYAEKSADFVPVASPKLAGEVVKNSEGKVTSRPVFPLKVGAKDTVFASFDQDLLNVPTVTYSNPAIAGSGVKAVIVKDKDKKDVASKKQFYEVVTAGAGFTGAVVATIAGAKANTFGPELIMEDTEYVINVDNTVPQVSSSSTGIRVGRGQLTTITINFNEKMSTKTANQIKISISDPNNKIKPVDAVKMELATNGLSASYVFLVEELVPNTAVHGPLTLTYTGGADEAGNPITITSAGLLLDVGTPPAPDLALDVTAYDLGTQIKWAGTQTIGTNTGGARAGTIYFVAVDAGEPGPVDISFDQDANAIWKMADKDPDPAVENLVKNRQQGNFSTNGNGFSGGGTTSSIPIFSTFAPNGTFDIYAVFVGTTGNKSAITATPQLASVVIN